MDDATKCSMLISMTGEKVQEVLFTYLTLAKGVVLSKAFPFGNFPNEVPPEYETTQVEIAAYLLNKRGAEGEISHSENGISRSYEDGDIPPTLLRRIVPKAGVITGAADEP